MCEITCGSCASVRPTASIVTHESQAGANLRSCALTKASYSSAEAILRAELTKGLESLPAGRKVMFKLTLPEVADFYEPLVRDKRVVRVVALSGGYTRAEACKRLALNHGMIASFSRALTQDLRRSMSGAEFDAALKSAIDEIYQASAVKVAA